METLLKSAIFQICVFGTACYVLAFVTRRVFEAGFTCLKRTPEDEKKPYPNAACRWWNEVILYAIPPAWGVGLALLLRKSVFFPDDFRSWQTAVIFGVAFGFLSGFLYKILKRLLLAMAKEKGVDSTDDPAAASTAAPKVPTNPIPDPAPADTDQPDTQP